MTETEMEIREALLGNTIPMENGHLRTMTEADYRLPHGVSDSGAAVRFLGVRQRSVVLSSELGKKALLKTVRKSLHFVGRTLVLMGQPETPCCIIRYVTTRPAIVTVRYINGVPVATAWSAKGMTGWISNRRALSSLRKQLPPEIEFDIMAPVPEEEKITRKEFRRDVREIRKDLYGNPEEEPEEEAEEAEEKEEKKPKKKKKKDKAGKAEQDNS